MCRFIVNFLECRHHRIVSDLIFFVGNASPLFFECTLFSTLSDLLKNNILITNYKVPFFLFLCVDLIASAYKIVIMQNYVHRKKIWSSHHDLMARKIKAAEFTLFVKFLFSRVGIRVVSFFVWSWYDEMWRSWGDVSIYKWSPLFFVGGIGWWWVYVQPLSCAVVSVNFQVSICHEAVIRIKTRGWWLTDVFLWLD